MSAAWTLKMPHPTRCGICREKYQVVEVMAPFIPFGKNRPLDVPPP
jgi:hypothetical protein